MQGAFTTFGYLVATAVVAGTLGACGGDQGASGMLSGTTTGSATTTQRATVSASGTGESSCPAGSVTVSGQANIFGAGSASAPGPGGEGGGVVPPTWQLPKGTRSVTFPTVTGTVTPMQALVDPGGPGGDRQGATDITSYGGISGILDRRNGMFLVGVFLSDDLPGPPAPKRLDFTKRERFRTLAPRIAQTFFVGDGKHRSVLVPRGATRLFLGFADAYSGGHFYQGEPGFYDNNGGHLCVAVKVE
jgi:hypothetical protein